MPPGMPGCHAVRRSGGSTSATAGPDGAAAGDPSVALADAAPLQPAPVSSSNPRVSTLLFMVEPTGDKQMAGQTYALISPCRDEARFMRRTLDSVAAQTLPPAVWVVVDDGSTD